MNSGKNVSSGYLLSHIQLTYFSLSHDQSSNRLAARIHTLSSWWPVRGGRTQPRIVDVPLVQAKEEGSIYFFSLDQSLMYEFTAQRCSRCSQNY
jgi:hypothetical protein